MVGAQKTGLLMEMWMVRSSHETSDEKYGFIASQTRGHSCHTPAKQLSVLCPCSEYKHENLGSLAEEVQDSVSFRL